MTSDFLRDVLAKLDQTLTAERRFPMGNYAETFFANLDRAGRIGRESVMMERDRKRKKNYTPIEEYELVEAYREMEPVLRPKFGSIISYKDKEQAWETITCRVNGVSTLQRTVSQTKKKWNNLSSAMKEHLFMEIEKRFKYTPNGTSLRGICYDGDHLLEVFLPAVHLKAGE